MALSYKCSTRAAFKPIEDIALRCQSEIKLGELKLLPPSKEIINDQFRRYKSTSIKVEKVSFLSNGDFFVYFKCEDKVYLCISTEFFAENEVDSIIRALDDYSLIKVKLEDCFFLHFCYYLSGIYKPRVSWTSEHLIQELGLGLREDLSDYEGHEVEELIDIYSPLIVFEVNDESALLNKDNWYLSCLLSMNCESLRSPTLSDDVFEISERLMTLGNVNLENIYLSMTSSHHKYCFIEIYRCLEAVYYLPWMMKLRTESGLTHDAFNLAKIVSRAINWRRKEEDSLQSIFSTLPFSIIEESSIKDVSFLSLKNISDDVKSKRELGSVIYRIRNQSVHQSAYEHTEILNILPGDWVVIIRFMYFVVEYVYRENKNDISFYQCSFPLE